MTIWIALFQALDNLLILMATRIISHQMEHEAVNNCVKTALKMFTLLRVF